MKRIPVKSGVKQLDEIISHIRLGDNVVWRVDLLEDYFYFARAFGLNGIRENRRVVYIRFANHPAIFQEGEGVEVVNMDSSLGFQHFSFEIYNLITGKGRGVLYIFDSLSALQQAWATDLMVGNFFVVTCPYLYQMETVAYFCLIRKRHDWATIYRIMETTQVMLEINNVDDGQVIQPKKVWKRDSPTMFLPHIWDEEKLIPQTDGLYHILRLPDPISHTHDYWEQLFIKADAMRWSNGNKEEIERMIERLCSILLGRDKKILSLSKEYFTLHDLLGIKNRMIGTGYIGGKAVGMLLARRIISGREEGEKKAAILQKDSLYVGSDVMETFLIHNGLWLLHMKQRSKEGYFSAAGDLRNKILEGVFPDVIMSQFYQALDALGKTPIIIRSSSLLEDGYGNAFAGKYQSIFCANQGTVEENMRAFIEAVKRVFASTVELEALAYRKKRGLNHLGEQMSVLVQRVSGSAHGSFFYPLAAGVGLSYSAYVWHKNMRPEKGMIRLVAGLGTRAVDRTDGDYSRIVSLDMPFVNPTDGLDDTRVQGYMDVLNIRENSLDTIPVEDGAKILPEEERRLLVSHDFSAEKRAKEIGLMNYRAFKTDFDNLFRSTDFLEEIKECLKKLETAYQCPVDIEFTVNFFKKKALIDLVQCRPMQRVSLSNGFEISENIAKENILFSLKGNFVGGKEERFIHCLVYINPKAYVELVEKKRHELARIIGKINALLCENEENMLIVPGRCGTTMASLGIPVKFPEINKFSAICEVEYPEGNMMPELSFGSHFFQDLVESNTYYASILRRDEDYFNEEIILSQKNYLRELLPDCNFENVIYVVIFEKGLSLQSDMKNQKTVCFRK